MLGTLAKIKPQWYANDEFIVFSKFEPA